MNRSRANAEALGNSRRVDCGRSPGDLSTYATLNGGSKKFILTISIVTLGQASPETDPVALPANDRMR